MGKCCVCRKEHSPFLPRHFHSFPTDTERREKWFNSIGYTVNAYKNARVCSDHFTEDDYYCSGTPVQIRRLKKTAVPSVLIQRSFRNVNKKNSRSNIQNDNQNKSIMGNKGELTMDIIYQTTLDIQQSIDIQDDNITSAEPIRIPQNNTGRKRKRCNINNIKKFFLRTDRYTIDCIRKSEFVTNKAWIKLVKYVNYNRYLHKFYMSQKLRLQKKILIMQSVVQTLQNKSLETNDV